ncbi:tyrosine-type recombinase/integrase [Mucilaginibacter sp. 22184]|uniref:tyrosine-type recombinase/integrase n=1 Tax=Mucilaginibacter sp. 22184 TaxID=3453887 RepID=UPI003F86F334
MTSIKVFPKLNKINKYGLAPVYLRLIKNRRVKYLSMDVYIDPKDWNDKTGKMKQTATNAEQINNFLAIKKSEAEMTVLEMESKSNFVSAHDLKAKMAGVCIGDFFAFFRKRLRERNDELSIGTLRRYKCVLNKLKSFCGKEQLFFDELNVTFLRNFKSYLQNDVSNHTNTIQSNLKVIRTLIYDAIAEELIPLEKNPFSKIKIKYEKTSREFLLDPELVLLEKLKLKDDTTIFHHRNVYIFSAYSAGIRISDLLTMRWKNFDGEHLFFTVRKNKEEISIKLPNKSLEILDYYRSLAELKSGKSYIEPENYIFPLLKISPKETDRLAIHNGISSATAHANKSLRSLAKKAKIHKNISFHTARHSWAVRALQKGMRIEYVSKLMGHASVTHTEVYAKILNQDLDKAMEVFNNPTEASA